MPSSRRHLLKSTAVAGLAAQSLSAAQSSPNDKIRIALIGAAGQGSDDANASLAQTGVELAAVSDVYEGRLIRA